MQSELRHKGEGVQGDRDKEEVETEFGVVNI